MSLPRPIAHVGMTVTDVRQAVKWYCEVLGFEAMGPPVEVSSDDGHAGAVAGDVFGPRFRSFRQAHLASANGVAIELFEFVEPATERRADNFEYWKTGIFHLCLVAPDIDELAERIARSGGRRRTAQVWEMWPGEPYRTCYCEDPFGNVIELYSHSHERTYANRNGPGVPAAIVACREAS
jgi:catechol 2,3-dioxygenase-like lactoylglutathione lyase family enzyme